MRDGFSSSSRSATHLSSCFGTEQMAQREPPAYLGERSLQLIDDINDLERSHDLAAGLIMFGTTVGTASPEGLAGEAVGVGVTGESTFLQGMPNAILDIYIIKGYRILQAIDFVRISSDWNDMNPQEQAFWNRVHDRVSELQGSAVNRRRSR